MQTDTDLSFVTVDIVDSDGNIVPNADQLVQFNLSGQGELVGVDNGDAASVERYKDSKRKVFNGKALAIVQADQQSGEITLHASVAGLNSDAIKIFTVSSAERETDGIAGVDVVNVAVDINKAPELPSTISVYYNDSTVASKNVTWENVAPSAAGNFTIEGIVEGTAKKATAFITVKEVVAVKPYATAINVGDSPVLPSEVTLLYSDETTRDVNVTWEEISNDKLSTVGSFVVAGSVDETDLKARAYIRVTAEQSVMSSTANLIGITVNGEALVDFDAANKHYELNLPYGSALPEIKAVGADNATVMILPAFTFPRYV